MLEIRPICEHCGKDLPNGSKEAMICSFECTFCAACVNDVLQNVCPNCGGGFEKRPSRPVSCVTENCVANFPLATVRKFRPVDQKKFAPVFAAFKDLKPEER
jgi:hypothetical protein